MSAVSVNDVLFSIRVPSFVTVHGLVRYLMGGYRGELPIGQELRYRKHGKFVPVYAGDDHAVIKHTTTRGEDMFLFVPQQKMLSISNGVSKVGWVHYPSYQMYSSKSPQPPEPNEDLYDAYVEFEGNIDRFLFSHRRFPDTNDQEDELLFLRHRLDYGWLCAFHGQPIPPDCELGKLVSDFYRLTEGYPA